MPGSLTLVASNRLETLCDRLAEILLETPPDPLAPDVVMVQSRGMERWLRLELARPRRLGICANLRFPFPNRFLADVVDRVFPGRYDGGPFERDVLAWRVLGLLPNLATEAGFAPVASYLAAGEAGDDARSYDFAWAVADRLDQYVLYRPDVLLGWEKGHAGDWQAELWRRICADVAAERPGAIHRAALRQRLLGELDRGTDLGAQLGVERVCVFGVSVLPPFHLDVLDALSRHVEVTFLLLNPSRQYWFRIMSERGKARFLKRRAELAPTGTAPRAEEEKLESGNPLLPSLGRLGQAFFDDLYGRDIQDESDFGPDEPPEDSVLHVIQADVLDMVDRRPGGERDPRLVAADDRSLVVSACHSAMREAEVLRDYLLDLFDRCPDLSPGDVLVMSPDIDAYGPVLEAVLESEDDGRAGIPVSVSDRPVLGRSGLARTVLRVLGLPESRCPATETLSFLADPRVRERFGFGEGDGEVVAEWVREAGIRWGLDGEHRASLGLPAERQNTWEAGIDRLLLGCLMSRRDPAEGLYRGILSTDGPEGTAAAALGSLADLLGAVKAVRTILAGSHEAAEWPDRARGALAALLGEELGGEDEGEELDAALRALASDVRSAGPGVGPGALLGIGAVRAALTRRLGDEGAGGRFLNGRLTVCKMQPMRSIPAEVICLVGMNDGSFPAREKPPGFDIMASEPRSGDRSRVDEDRYLFLETIVSARSALYVSFVGQSIRDNSPIAPAVPVSLLLDYAAKAFVARTGTVRDRLVTLHPLQPFSPRYLRDGLFTYSRTNADAARALLAPEKKGRVFCPGGLRPPEAREPVITLEELVRFLRNPAAHFVKKRLGFTLDEAAAAIEDREPFILSGLDRYGVEQEILAEVVRGGPGAAAADALGRVLRASGRLPHGAVGDLSLENVRAEVEAFWSRVEGARGGEPAAPLAVSFAVEGGTVEARVRTIHGSRLVLYRCGRLRAVDRIELWLTHLLVAAAVPTETPWSSMYVASDATAEIDPLDDAGERLAEIVAQYRDGWSRPLPFFPETSLAYALAARDGDSRRALAAARTAWEPSRWKRSDAEDPYFGLCFGDGEPLGDEFAGLAGALLGPCVRAQTVRKARP